MKKLAAVALLAAAACACRQVLDIPSDSQALSAIADKLCSCPLVAKQSPDVAAYCEEAAAAADDAKLIQLEGCDDCDAAATCYGSLTGAAAEGGACAESKGCQTFACCMEGIQFGGGISGSCCASCKPCSALYEINGDLGEADAIGVCTDGGAVFKALGTCLCQLRTSCPVACADRADPLAVGCPVQLASCSDCLIAQAAAQGGVCDEAINACLNDRPRPASPEGG